jgi:hypothetical protein
MRRREFIAKLGGTRSCAGSAAMPIARTWHHHRPRVRRAAEHEDMKRTADVAAPDPHKYLDIVPSGRGPKGL